MILDTGEWMNYAFKVLFYISSFIYHILSVRTPAVLITTQGSTCH